MAWYIKTQKLKILNKAILTTQKVNHKNKSFVDKSAKYKFEDRIIPFSKLQNWSAAGFLHFILDIIWLIAVCMIAKKSLQSNKIIKLFWIYIFGSIDGLAASNSLKQYFEIWPIIIILLKRLLKKKRLITLFTILTENSNEICCSPPFWSVFRPSYGTIHYSTKKIKHFFSDIINFEGQYFIQDQQWLYTFLSESQNKRRHYSIRMS